MVIDDTIMDETEVQAYQEEQDLLTIMEGAAFMDCCIFIFQVLWLVAVEMGQILSGIFAGRRDEAVFCSANAVSNCIHNNKAIIH